MNVTDYLVQKSKGLLQIQPEINDWTGCQYKMFNDAGIEVEVGEFFYGLVRVLKPIRILETGTHKGISASYMAQAMLDNGLFGEVDTIEHHQPFYQKAVELFNNLELTKYIHAINGNIDDFHPGQQQYGLMFLDSEPDRRFKELTRFYPNLKQGGMVFIHDLHRHMSQEDNAEHGFGFPFGILPDQIQKWVQDGDLRPWHFPTPRGLVGFYKPDPRDYKWL